MRPTLCYMTSVCPGRGGAAGMAECEQVPAAETLCVSISLSFAACVPAHVSAWMAPEWVFCVCIWPQMQACVHINRRERQ